MPNEDTRIHTEPQERHQRATLSTILDAVRGTIPALRARRAGLERAALAAPPAPRWDTAFGHADVSIIAEIKRRSPSAGDIAPGLEPRRLAEEYVAGGARAISVLTDGPHFGGSLADLETVRAAVPVPLLRKDFIIDPVQLFESRAAGASAVLLIARALGARQLEELARLARELGLAILVEVHRPEELQHALAVDPDTLGINSRDLETFRIDLGITERMLADVPTGVIAVAESGLHDRRDVENVARWGADAVLIGTALASAPDPRAAVGALAGCPRIGRAGR